MDRPESPLRRLLNRITPENGTAENGTAAAPPTPLVARPASRDAPAPAPPAQPPRTPGGQQDHGIRFSVRPARPADTDGVEPVPPVPYSPPPAVEWRVAGRFPAPHRALGAIEALRGAGATEWSCHEEPGGEAVWLLSAIGPALGTELLTLHGATARPMPPDTASEVTAWPRLDVVDLVSRLPLAPPGTSDHRTLHVLTAPELLPSVVRQALAFGVEVSTRAVRVRYLTGTDPTEQHTTLVVLEGSDTVPHALTAALSALPRTSVCRAVAACERLLLDVRLHCPVPDDLLYSPVPEGELWLVGDRAEWPALRLDPLGPPTPVPAELVGVPSEPPYAARRLPDAAREPSVEVRVVADATADTSVDAVLLHDDELPLLRRYLRGRPLGEAGFLLPGPGCHLLLEPVGLARDLPFGVPLRRVGPGSLFLESGHTLAPPLPPSARARLFALDDESAVVCRRGGRYRFPLSPMVPLWTLWAPPGPVEVSAGLSEAGRELLDALESLAGPGPVPHPTGPAAVHDPGEALERAARLRALGDHEGAAEAYRSAGDLLEAARLYEAAALHTTEEQ
ncbi:hypothetical protein [Streptomyces sp. NPDC020489]|uniref:hypothetical protein n=1 Tax=Streptomyces sp. NPDC020489 TaxID=3365077 RepID=UPI003787747B